MTQPGQPLFSQFVLGGSGKTDQTIGRSMVFDGQSETWIWNTWITQGRLFVKIWAWSGPNMVSVKKNTPWLRGCSTGRVQPRQTCLNMCKKKKIVWDTVMIQIWSMSLGTPNVLFVLEFAGTRSLSCFLWRLQPRCDARCITCLVFAITNCECLFGG